MNAAELTRALGGNEFLRPPLHQANDDMSFTNPNSRHYRKGNHHENLNCFSLELSQV